MKRVSAQLKGQACSDGCAKVSRHMQLSRLESLHDGLLIVIRSPTGLAPLQQPFFHLILHGHLSSISEAGCIPD